MKKNKIGYLIYLDGKDDYEYGLDDELLIFETTDQIKNYCEYNKINLDTVNVAEVELED